MDLAPKHSMPAEVFYIQSNCEYVTSPLRSFCMKITIGLPFDLQTARTDGKLKNHLCFSRNSQFKQIVVPQTTVDIISAFDFGNFNCRSGLDGGHLKSSGNRMGAEQTSRAEYPLIQKYSSLFLHAAGINQVCNKTGIFAAKKWYQHRSIYFEGSFVLGFHFRHQSCFSE